MQLLSKIYKQTERNAFANDCCYASLKHNPFLWHSYVDLCNRGEKPNAHEIFKIGSDELLEQMERQLCHVSSDQHYGENNSSSISVNHCTPNTNNNVVTIETVPASEETPLNNASMLQSHIEVDTPYRKSFKYLHSTMSPVTPSFGVLPLHSPHESLKQTTLFITPSPPLQQQSQLLIENSEKNNSNKKIRGNLNSLVSRKEISTTPLLNQSSNITPNPRTPQPQAIANQNSQNQSVRRSSRIFSNYSVKENNKSPKFSKFAQPRSPPRKTSKRVSSKTSKTALNELNEKNCLLSEKEKIETITSAQSMTESFQQYSYQQIQVMKRQSADGLMQLLQTLGEAYLKLQQYELHEAQEVIETKVPHAHLKSSWVQSILAVIHHERREYDEACKIFADVRKGAPYRTQYMEIYSTDLWHLQKETLLSVLAQDLMQHDKTSAVTWCVAGNCFSALKEHDTAIKYFNRAIQLDPEFAYAYTLLGHELVVTEELEKALTCYRKAILKDTRHYNAWYGIGTIYSKQERFQLAQVHYEHSLKINRNNSVILVHIGVMQFYLDKREEALRTLLSAIKIDPKNPLCKFHHASMSFKMGRFQEALDELEELKQLVPKESVVFYLIGKIHKQLGNIDLALMHFSWATDLGTFVYF